MKPLLLALLIAVGTVTGASAQAAAQRDANTTTTWEDFLSHDAPPTVIVIDEAGIEVRGRLVLLTDDDLTLALDDGREQTLLRSRVAAVYQRGDSVKNGAAIGFLILGGMAAMGVRKEDCTSVAVFNGGPGGADLLRSCTAAERAGLKIVIGLMHGGLGAGIGALFDNLIPGRRLLYQRPRTAPAIISVTPMLTASRVGLSMGMSW